MSLVGPSPIVGRLTLVGSSRDVERSAIVRMASRSRTWTCLSLLLLASFGIWMRVAIAGERVDSLGATPPMFWGDESGYEGLAHRLTQGEFFKWPGRAPGYPLLIAAVYAVAGGRTPMAALYVQAVLAAITVVPLTFIFARRFVGPVAAVVAAGIAALNPAIAYQARLLYSEILFTPLLLVVLILAHAAIDRPTARRWIAVGVAMAGLAFVRPTAILLPAILMIAVPLAWTLRQRLRATLIAGLAMALTILPWTLYNAWRHRAFIPIASSTAVLWQGSPEFYVLVKYKPFKQIWKQELNPRWNGGHDPFRPEGERYFNDRAVRSIVAHPLTYARYCLDKAGYFWFGNALTETSYANAMRGRPMGWTYADCLWLGTAIGRNVPFVGLIAVVALLARRRIRPLGMTLAVIGYFWLLHAATFAGVRYSTTLHPQLAILAVAAGSGVRRRVPAAATFDRAERFPYVLASVEEPVASRDPAISGAGLHGQTKRIPPARIGREPERRSA